MPEPKPPNVDQFIGIVTNPGTRSVAAAFRKCDDCGKPSSVAWAVHIPALDGRASRSMAIVFYCAAHSQELDAKLQASNTVTQPD